MKNLDEQLEELKQENLRLKNILNYSLKIQLKNYSNYEQLLQEELDKNRELTCKIRTLEMDIDNLRTRNHY